MAKISTKVVISSWLEAGLAELELSSLFLHDMKTSFEEPKRDTWDANGFKDKKYVKTDLTVGVEADTATTITCKSGEPGAHEMILEKVYCLPPPPPPQKKRKRKTLIKPASSSSYYTAPLTLLR